MFAVKSDIRGRRIALSAEHSRGYLEAAPAIRVVREQDGAPAKANGGLVLFDAHRQFGDPAAPSVGARRVRGLTSNAVRDGGLAEFELWEAHYRSDPNNPNLLVPKHLHVDIWDSEQKQLKEHRFTEITAASTQVSQVGPWTKTTTTYLSDGDFTAEVELWSAPGQSPYAIYSSVYNDPIQATYDVEETWTTTHTFDPDLPVLADKVTRPQFAASFAWQRGGATVLSGALRNIRHPELGGHQLSLALSDAVPSAAGAAPGLDPHTYYYYALMLEAVGPDGPEFDGVPVARGAAMATGEYGEGERLYQRLPAIHRAYDEPDAKVQGQGQLRRFLQIFGGALDQARGFTEGLHFRNDVFNVDRASLPQLAHWIGWDVDRTNPGEVQRNDVLLASDIFERVGTEAALKALISRATAWDFQIREFHKNVAFTNERPVGYWDMWEALSLNGVDFVSSVDHNNPNPRRLAGRPALVVGGGTVWEFWHEFSSGRRELWAGWPLLNHPPLPVAADPLDDPDSVDESPAAILDGNVLRLFWSSNRGGNWNLWTRTVPQSYAGGPLVGVGDPEPVTNHSADERSPAAVVQPHESDPLLDRLWLFWQSNRRGPTDIWAQTRVGGLWSEPSRVTSALVADRTPAVALDAGAPMLFWSATTEHGCRLFTSKLKTPTGEEWSAPVEVLAPGETSSTSQFRDESPCAVQFQSGLRLYWHSNRSGSWQLWTRVKTVNGWSPATQVLELIGLQKTRMVDAKEPAAVVHNNQLRACWRAQRRGEGFTTRTMFASDQTSREAMAQIGDWNHYTHDAGRQQGDWYALDTIGIYVKAPPKPADVTLEKFGEIVDNEMDLVRNFVEPYRPATVRIVWFKVMPPQS